jgi:hypothetical protein
VGAGLPPPTNKIAVACQRALLQAGATFLTGKLQSLDQCVTGIFKCVETKPDDDGCTQKALPSCGGKLAALQDAEDRFTSKVAKQCDGLTAAALAGADGLGFGAGTIVDGCRAQFGIAIDDPTSTAPAAPIIECVLRGFARAAENAFDVEQARVRELLGFLAVTPLPLCNLPTLDSDSCLLKTDSGADQCLVNGTAKERQNLVKCAAKIAGASRAFTRSIVTTTAKCIKSAIACDQTVAAEKQAQCRAKAQTTCSRAFASITKARAKLDKGVTLQCAEKKVPFTALQDPQGLDVLRLADGCTAVGSAAPTDLAAFTRCLRRTHECAACETLRGAVPNLDHLLTGVVFPDGFCIESSPCPTPTTSAVVSTSVGALERLASQNSVTNFIRSILDDTPGVAVTTLIPGGFRAPTATAKGSVTGFVGQRFVGGSRVQKITINYQLPTGADPRLLIVARGTDGQTFDLFQLSGLNPASTSQDLTVTFNDSVDACVRLEVATAEGDDGEVSDYVPFEQVPGFTASATPAATGTPTPTHTPSATVTTTLTTTASTSTPSPAATSTPVKTATPATPIATPTPTGPCQSAVAPGLVVATTWTAAKSPYCVLGDIDVSLLTIEPGVTVLLSQDASINVLSTITAVGTDAQPIVFTARDQSTPWAGIKFVDASQGSQLVHVVIEYADDAGISIVNTSPVIMNAVIQHNTSSTDGAGVRAVLDASHEPRTRARGQHHCRQHCQSWRCQY